MPLLKKPVILAAAFGSIVLGALPVHPAERFRPPSEVLREPANVLAVAMAAEIVGPARIRFEVVELLSDERAEKLAEVSRDQQTTQVGPSPDAENADQSWNVGMSPKTAAEVRLGGTYIIGISRYLRGRFPLPKWRLDPEGYRLVELPVVGEAIFGFSAHLEFLLTTTPGSMRNRRERSWGIFPRCLGASRTPPVDAPSSRSPSTPGWAANCRRKRSSACGR